MLLVYFLISRRPLTQWNMIFILQKLSRYGVRGDTLSWFQSYLNNRYHFVTYNGVSSDKKEVKCWVPQGSILGSLLFLININDLSDVCKCSLPILFVDDTNVFYHVSDLSVIENAFNKELADISKWLNVNKLGRNLIINWIYESIIRKLVKHQPPSTLEYTLIIS